MVRFGVAAVAATLALAAALATPVQGGSAAPVCGAGGRSNVGTLRDRPRLLPMRKVTLAYLVDQPVPSVVPSTRLRFERHVFRVHASVAWVRDEAGGELRLMLQDGPARVVAKAPSPECTAGALPRHRREMALARAAVQPCKRAAVTGVAFFDAERRQTVALEPLLGFSCPLG